MGLADRRRVIPHMEPPDVHSRIIQVNRGYFKHIGDTPSFFQVLPGLLQQAGRVRYVRPLVCPPDLPVLVKDGLICHDIVLSVVDRSDVHCAGLRLPQFVLILHICAIRDHTGYYLCGVLVPGQIQQVYPEADLLLVPAAIIIGII